MEQYTPTNLGGAMSKLRCHISISLDGFVAGPNQSEKNYPPAAGPRQLKGIPCDSRLFSVDPP
jgi:hypothetical protein